MNNFGNSFKRAGQVPRSDVPSTDGEGKAGVGDAFARLKAAARMKPKTAGEKAGTEQNPATESNRVMWRKP